jgi:hypothetical protein
MMNELKSVGYEVDDSSITRTKWGIGKGLYLEFVKFLQNYNAWRRGDKTLEMPHPAEIGANIQDAIVILREHEKLTRRAKRAEAEVKRLKSDGAASAFVNMSSCASRAETDRNNLRADLDAIKAILNEEKARAERAEAELTFQRERNSRLFEQRDAAVEAQDKAEAELAAERARLDAVVDNCWIIHKGNENAFAVRFLGEYITPWVATPRAAIDAAMKDDGK